MPPAITMLQQHGPYVPMVTASKSPLVPRVPSDTCKASDMPPPRTATHHRPAAQPRASAGRQERLHYAVAARPVAAAVPMRIPTRTSSHPQQLGSAEPAMLARRAGMEIAVARNGGHNQDPFAQRNTWPRNGSSRLNRHGSGGSNSNAPARSPLFLYGDGSFHSFTVCGTPGCKVCTNERPEQRSASFVGEGSAGGDEGAEADQRPGRSLVQRPCEHCLCPFVPKPRGVDDRGVVGPKDDVAQGSECGDSSAASSLVEGTLAGGISPSSFSTLNEEDRKEEDSSRPFSPLVGARPRFSPQQQQHVSEDDDDNYPVEDGFCSGDCKISYMLTNAAAVRRRRAAAVANAAARAANIEAMVERSRRAARSSVTGRADQ